MWDNHEEPEEVTLEGVTIEAETEMAYLIETGDGDGVWLPKSQILYQDIYEKGECGSITIPEWLAKEKVLI